jgi:hypothetical protein
MIPIVLTEIMAGDWRLVVEKDGDHYAASVIPVYGSVADYRTVLRDTPEDAIESACAFIASRGGNEDAQSLKELATAEVKKNIKRGDTET